MIAGKFYTHDNMLDCMIHVLGLLYVDSTETSVKVEWWVKRGFRLPVRSEIVRIKHKDQFKWARVNDVKIT